MELGLGIMLMAGTSIAAYFAARFFAHAGKASLSRAAGEALECIGTGVFFFALNVVVAIALILLIRGLTPFFVSVYFLDDPLFLAASFFQGLIFKMWWRS